MKKQLGVLFIIALSSVHFACTSEQQDPAHSKVDSAVTPSSVPTAAEVFCVDPRPQVCTKEYRPVCARVNPSVSSGIGKEAKCEKEPCPPLESHTYATACTACADSKVVSYVPGACEDAKSR